MRTVCVLGSITFVLGSTLYVGGARAQNEGKQRQAAAEAYDQGTAAYLSGDYEKAAEWFETANRMSPAAPALIQAARAHQQAGHATRAATLALRLTIEHPDDASATQFARGVLDKLGNQLVRVDVSCDGCTLEVDGALEESASFFVEPDTTHKVTASFETGVRHAEVAGSAGEEKSLEFTAPAGQIAEPPAPTEGGPKKKPLAPIYTIVGASVTGALLIGSIISTVDMNAGVNPYETAVQKYNDCIKKGGKNCESLYQTAKDKLDSGQGKETRSTILWIATGVVGAATSVAALFFTNWSGGGSTEPSPSSERALRVNAAPLPNGMNISLQGKF